MTFLLDILPLIASIVLGIITELFKQKMAYNYQTRQAELEILKTTEKSIEAARKYQTPHTSKIRKFLVIVICLPLLFPMILEVYNWGLQAYAVHMLPHTPWAVDTLQKSCVYIPEAVKSGGLLSWIYNKETMEYTQICGFVMFPIYVYAFQVVLGFYFGQAGAKVKAS